MKTYTIEFELQEGYDKFWESNPSPQQVYELVCRRLGDTDLDYYDVKIIKIIDETVYDQYSGKPESEWKAYQDLPFADSDAQQLYKEYFDKNSEEKAD